MTRNPVTSPEFRSSVVEAFRTDEPRAADIQRAYLRFSWNRRRPSFGLPVLRWLLAGIAVGIGGASAATLISSPRHSTPSGDSVDSSARVPARSKPRAAQLEIRSGATSAPPASAEPVQHEPIPTAKIRERAATQPSTNPRGPFVRQGEWQTAAEALRMGDVSRAEAALAKLEKSENTFERQAAEMARAQLLVSHGRANEVEGVLERLSIDGRSELIRTQAATLLQSVRP